MTAPGQCVTTLARFDRSVPLIIGGAMLVQTLNSTVIVNALPSMARTLNSTAVEMNVAITAYFLAGIAFLPLSSWMSDKFGSRTIFRAAIVGYMLSSLACGAAQTLGQLLTARIFEGASGAMMTPVGRAILLRTVPRTDLVRATAYLTMPSLLGTVIGPLIGGLIVTYFSWRWIFMVNLPIGLLAVVLVSLRIPDIREEQAKPLDTTGALLSGFGLAACIFGLQNVAHGPLAPSSALGVAGAGACALALYVAHARRTEHPILDFSLLRIRTFAAGVVGGQFLRMLNGATPFLLTILLQVGFGLSALDSGLMTFMSGLAAVLMKTTAAPILKRFGFRTVLSGNAVIVALTFSSYALFTPRTPHGVIMLLLFLGGFFRSLQFTALNTLAFVDVSRQSMGNGSTLVAMALPLAQTLGVAAAAALIQANAYFGNRIVDAGTIAPVFAILGIGSLASLAFFLQLPPGTGDDVTGRRAR